MSWSAPMPFENHSLHDASGVFNPYRPPSSDNEKIAAIVPGEPNDGATRRTYLARERTIRRLAWLNVALAIVWFPLVLATVAISFILLLGMLGLDFRRALPGMEAMPSDAFWPFLALAVFHGGCFALNIALAIGLRRLQPWARWIELVLAGGFLTLCLFSTAIEVVTHGTRSRIFMIQVPAAILSAWITCLLLSSRTRFVFTRHYREVVSRTKPVHP
jgi:hypothetical protein